MILTDNHPAKLEDLDPAIQSLGATLPGSKFPDMWIEGSKGAHMLDVQDWPGSTNPTDQNVSEATCGSTVGQRYKIFVGPAIYMPVALHHSGLGADTEGARGPQMGNRSIPQFQARVGGHLGMQRGASRIGARTSEST